MEVLGYDNFTEFVEENDHVVVTFVAPWCAHSKRLWPEFVSAAREMHGDGVLFAKVDGPAEPTLSRNNGVTGYPTIIVFEHGDAKPFKAGRTAPEIVEYVRKVVAPPATHLADLAAVQAFAESQKVRAKE